MAITNEKGVLVSRSEIATGTSKATGKDWKSQTIIVKVDEGQYSHNLAIRAFGERVDALAQVKDSSDVEVGYSASSRRWEKDGRSGWSTDLNLVSIKEATATPAPAPAPAPEPDDNSLEPQEKDLPF